jgi:nitrogen regulatory protein PII
MKRIEIIANRSVEDNIHEVLREEGVAQFYTELPIVHGVGAKGPRMGDAVWPEENFMMVVWCDEDEARRIKKAIEPVKTRYPGEGIKIFGV